MGFVEPVLFEKKTFLFLYLKEPQSLLPVIGLHNVARCRIACNSYENVLHSLKQLVIYLCKILEIKVDNNSNYKKRLQIKHSCQLKRHKPGETHSQIAFILQTPLHDYHALSHELLSLVIITIKYTND